MIYTPFDIEHEDEVLELIRQFHAEASYYKHEPFDVEVVREYYQACTFSPDGFGLLALDQDKKVVGFMAGILVPSLFNRNKVAEDLSLYLLPQWRKRGGVALKLISEYVKWARDKGVKDRFIRISVSAGIDNAGISSFLERLGFNKVGSSYALGSVN